MTFLLAHAWHRHSSETEIAHHHDGLTMLLLVAIVLVTVILFRLGRRGLVALGAGLLGVLVAVGCGGRPQAAVGMPQPKHDVETLAALFAHFKGDGVRFRVYDEHFTIESSGFPNHPMMVGITAWQQQVPLPQPYTGKNAWQIPLTPIVAERPISAKKALYRGAIAIAVNGVPIFNALNNRGEDAYLVGELDEFGGHCGKGDDYHYHIAPLHLEKVVGKGKPIAFALDGFPLHGTTDAQGKEPTDLDEFNGRFEDGHYRYYSTKKYPYINGGMRGIVEVRGDQIDPQPKASPGRPPGEPLRGAKITEFKRNDEKRTYTLKYEVRGVTQTVRYTVADDSVSFTYIDGQGREREETHRRKNPNH